MFIPPRPTVAATTQSTSRTPNAWGYRPELDGLRFVAVSLVILFHSKVAAFTSGFVGVDLFFVLSGFLVCGVMLAEIEKREKFDLLGFYARRVRRLLPAAVLVAVATCALLLITTPQGARVEMLDDAKAALLNYANWHFVASENDYFADGDTSAFMHYWSLAVEEQYYLLFPLIVIAALAWARKRAADGRALIPTVEKTLLVVCGIGVIASLAAQIATAGSNPTLAYYGTHTRVYQLLAGALLCVALRRLGAGQQGLGRRRTATQLPPTQRNLRTLVTEATPLFATAALIVLASPVTGLSTSTRGIVATVVSLLILGGLTIRPTALAARLLSLKPLNYLGRISYGTYLWHWPVIVFFTSTFKLDPVVLAVLVFVLASGLSAASFELLENPIRRNNWLEPRRLVSVGTGAAFSVLSALLVVPMLMQSPVRPAAFATDTANGGLSALTDQELSLPVVPTNPPRSENSGSTKEPSPTASPTATPTTEPSPTPTTAPEVNSEGELAAADRAVLNIELLPDGWYDPVPSDFDARPYLDAKPEPSPTCTVATIDDCVAVPGATATAPHLVLLGDSHAGMYQSAVEQLAKEKGFKLSIVIKLGCPWQPGLASAIGTPDGAQACIDRRDEFYKELLPAMDADVVLAIAKGRSEGDWRESTIADDTDKYPDESFDAMMLRKIKQGANLVRAAGAELVIVKSTFGTVGYDVEGFSMVNCLARAQKQGDCGVIPPAEAVVDSFYDAVATERDDVRTIDMRPVYCPTILCGPFIDDLLVWRDSGHLSQPFTYAHREELWTRLNASGTLTR